MILTVTMNASVDITYILDAFKLNESNRVTNVKKTAGGKGLNVARVLKQMEESVIVTGIAGGTTGEFICQQLDAQEIPQFFCKVSGESRNNLSIIQAGKQTEILEPGPRLSLEELKIFEKKYTELLKRADTIVLSGSLPQGVPAEYYATLIQKAKQQGKSVVLDTSGQSLQRSLKEKPTLIKPNKPELEELLGITIDSMDSDSLKEVLQNEVFKGIEWIVVSLGAEGAIVKRKSECYRVTVPKIEALNPIGSGDSTIAGFALGIDKHLSTEEIIRQGMTFGVLNALEHEPGRLKQSAFQEIYPKITIVGL